MILHRSLLRAAIPSTTGRITTAFFSTSPVPLEKRANGVFVLRLSNPPVNALDLPTIKAFGESVHQAASDPSCKALVVAGSSRAFCAGLDFKAVLKYSQEQHKEMVRIINSTLSTLYLMPKPTIAAVEGPAVGGGFCIAVSCDYRVMGEGENCKLALAEVTRGLPFPTVPLAILCDTLPPPSSRVLILTGAVISGQKSVDLGVIDRVVPNDAVFDAAIARADELCKYTAYGAIKKQMRKRIGEELRELVEKEDDPLLRGEVKWA